MTRPGFSGMQPSFLVAGDLIMCRIRRLDGEEEIPLGHEVEVEIELPYGEHYIDYIHADLAFNLQLGGWLVGEGKVLTVQPPSEP